MKKILISTILISKILFAHDLIDTTDLFKIDKKCKLMYTNFDKPIEEKIYNNIENKIVGVSYHKCENPKNKKDNLYTFFMNVETLYSSNALLKKNGKYIKGHKQRVERIKIDLDTYLSIEKYYLKSKKN